MALTYVQKGVSAEYEFQKLVILGGRGKLEPARPATDDNQIDAQVSVRNVFNLSVAVQIKSSFKLMHLSRAFKLSHRFHIEVSVRRSHPLYWYLFTHLDPKLMGGVPGGVLH